jgi:hypothetical protein
MKGVIVYFPWGAAGNLVRNIITIDPRFDFFDNLEFRAAYPTAEERFNWLLAYYQQPMDPTKWLQREWSIRQRLHTCYYTNNTIQFWNPDALVAYDCHGEEHEIDEILANQNLRCYDQHRISTGERAEQISTWRLQDCNHVFLLPADTKLIAEIYNSKNPALNQLNGTLQEKQTAALGAINAMSNRLSSLVDPLVTNGGKVGIYTADTLYSATGYKTIYDIVTELRLDITLSQVKTLHSIWLQSTKEVYYNYFNRELTT